MRAQLPGLMMAYETRGSGLPLLLLHGFPFSRAMWRPQLDQLVDSARMIAPDLRGHGESSAKTRTHTMAQMASDAAALLDYLDIHGPVVVGGLSMGGYVALAFYRLYPERVAGLVLAATRAGADSPEGKANRDKAAALAREKGTMAVVETLLPKLLAPDTYTARPDLVKHVRDMMARTPPDGVVGALMGMKERPDSTPLLENIDRPVLVVHGAEDQLFPPAEAEAMHQRLKNSRLALLPRAGHMVNLEQPISFNAELRTFLKHL